HVALNVLADGQKISKDKTRGGAYYAFDPPGNITATPTSFDRNGSGPNDEKPLIINGSFFRDSLSNPPTIKITTADVPTLFCKVTSFSNSQLQVKVPRSSTGAVCSGGATCATLAVRNPGGEGQQDGAFFSINLAPGPPPSLLGLSNSFAPTAVAIGPDAPA